MSKVYILGAGSSKAVMDAAPLNNELLPRVLKLKDVPPVLQLTSDPAVERIQAFVQDFYAFHWGEFTVPPLEDVLTQIDLCIAENRPISEAYSLLTLRELREDLIFAICRVLAWALGERQASRTGENRAALMDQFVEQRLRPEDTVIFLNYDLIIDTSLAFSGRPLSYGFPVRDYWDFDKSQNRWEDVTSQLKPQETYPNHQELLKLHGSLNWLYCPSCRAIDVTRGVKGALYIFQKDTLDRDNQESDKPIICRECGVRHDPYIVTPTFLKNYGDLYLSQIWQRAEDHLSHADQIIFIGYSLPDADIVFRSMISRAVYRNRNRRQKSSSPNLEIKVVDYDPCYKANDKNPTQLRYEKLFGNVVYDAAGFAPYLNKPESTA